MLRLEYLSRKLTSPLPTKDGGTLRTIGEACEYMAAIGKERERRLHWQRVREVMLQEADEAAVTWRVQLAVLKDAKLDVTALSEPIERMRGRRCGCFRAVILQPLLPSICQRIAECFVLRLAGSVVDPLVAVFWWCRPAHCQRLHCPSPPSCIWLDRACQNLSKGAIRHAER